MEIISAVKVFGGSLVRFSHLSVETGTSMICSIYLPFDALNDNSSTKFPYIMYLSGLTCTDENVCQKSGIFRKLAELNVNFLYSIKIFIGM